MNKYLNILLFCFLFLLQLEAGAKSWLRNFNIKNFSIGEGLSQSTLTCIYQDSKGFIWIGTQDGLNKYDGYNFRVFRHEPSKVETISSNLIQGICEDENSNIWIATQYGLNFYDRGKDLFKTILKNENDKNSLPDNNIYTVFSASNGNVWIKTSRYISCLDKNKKIISYQHSEKFARRITENMFYSILEKDKKIWFSSSDGLCCLDTVSKEIKKYYPSKDDVQIRRLLKDEFGKIWLCTKKGIYFYDENQDKLIKQKNIDNNTNVLQIISEEEIWTGGEDGLFRHKIKGNSKEKQNVINELVSDIIVDYSGIIWVATWHGLYKIIQRKREFKYYKKSKNFPISSNVIAQILIDHKGFLWLGTWSDGLNKTNPKTGETTYFSKEEYFNKIPNNAVRTLYQDNKKNIWIGTQNGVAIFDYNSKNTYSISQKYPQIDKKVFENNSVNEIIQTFDKLFWFATNNGLFYLKKGKILKFEIRKNKSKGSISENTVNDILEDEERNIWLGTSDGLIKINRETNEIKHYKTEEIQSKGLSHNGILSLCNDPKGVLWIGTEVGLNRFDKKSETFQFFVVANGFANDYMYSILRDKYGNLWIGTNKGLSKFNPQTRKIVNFDVNDGLQGYEFNMGAATKAENGEMFFGGTKGCNSFFPDSVEKKNTNIPRVSITKVMLNIYDDEVQNENKKQKQVQKHIDCLETLIIPENCQVFSIYFSALEFHNPQNNRYQYKMEGLSERWINIKKQRFVSFSKIPFGTYTLRIKGSNNNEVWTKEDLKLIIKVEANIWEYFSNKLALLIYLISFLTMTFLVVFFAKRETRKKTKAAKKIEQQKEDLKAKTKALTEKNQSITDSINYARRIIDAMMASSKKLKKILPESFIFFKPKDIVSGDFFWIAEKNNKIFVTAVDCTGHGVPGAFMSIIGVDLLRNIIKEQGIEDPAIILEKMHKGVYDTLQKDEENVQDGMDMAFCVIDFEKNILEYSGALNPLYLIRNNNIVETKGNRFPVGDKARKQDKLFTKQTIPIQENDMIYIFSDGYADQFGGPKGKKFKYRRLRHLLLTIHKHPLNQQKELLERSMKNWKGEHEQVDDILVIGIKPYNILQQREQQTQLVINEIETNNHQ